jgi:HAD superfamily hydrolase (TIGR01509 family)
MIVTFECYDPIMRALIFDLDGTLVDTVFGHVLAWQRSFAAEGMIATASSIHVKIGLGGKELAQAIGRELGKKVSSQQAERLDERHGAIMKELLPHPQPTPGAASLLGNLRALNVKYGIATSSSREGAQEPLSRLGIAEDVVVICKSDVTHAKPEPDLFLTCQRRLKVPPSDCFVIGDAVWDMLAARRSGMLGVGVLTGGIGQAELTQAGAYRVYADPSELDVRLHELGLAQANG